ncbi:helicase [Marivirga lumbricoides]|uniref:Helicase n=1 Tax=Marivirga lumbricoides TaxID=1046115 RepID=A0ABQ1MCX0_9BACT|nr:helicase [Marivirga lumbricoides]
MAQAIKNQQEILAKMGISQLNAMQEEALQIIRGAEETILLSPTGTGKTIAFLLPILETLGVKLQEVQALILVPSRELALQIEQVVREMGSGFKANAIYGGRAGAKDKEDLKHKPAILIGTPGRIADHIRRETFPLNFINTLVLDEFDKSLEVGFEAEMKEIVWSLPNVQKKILTSATKAGELPAFMALRQPFYINYLKEGVNELSVKIVKSPAKDKLETLGLIVQKLGNQPGIIFCNFKDSIERVSDYLAKINISHGNFYGGLEQRDRERSLIMFRNGTYNLLLATDLAARGIDVPEIKFIIHYHLPVKAEEFTHRNGRTARMNQSGTAYVLQGVDEKLPDFIDAETITLEQIKPEEINDEVEWTTLFISGGRKDKISKGDIAGLFLKEGNLRKEELGVIELKQDCAFVAVRAERVKLIIKELNNSKLKKKKVRITVVE